LRHGCRGLVWEPWAGSDLAVQGLVLEPNLALDGFASAASRAIPSPLKRLFGIGAVGLQLAVQKQDSLSRNIAVVQYWMFVSKAILGSWVFKDRRGIVYPVIHMLLAEWNADPVCTVSQVKVAGDPNRRLATNDARLSAFLVWRSLGFRFYRRSLFQNAAQSLIAPT